RFRLYIGKLEPLHQDRLWLILVTDDADHLVEIEINNEVAVEHLDAAGDLLQPMVGAPDEDLAPMGEPLPQHPPKSHHPRNHAPREDVEVERDTGLEIGQLE